MPHVSTGWSQDGTRISIPIMTLMHATTISDDMSTCRQIKQSVPNENIYPISNIVHLEREFSRTVSMKHALNAFT